MINTTKVAGSVSLIKKALSHGKKVFIIKPETELWEGFKLEIVDARKIPKEINFRVQLATFEWIGTFNRHFEIETGRLLDEEQLKTACKQGKK